MPHALTMTMPIKQTPDNLAKLAQLKEVFADQIQPKIEAALRESKIVHFARVVVIHDKYLQVITEYDGSPEDYTEFFRNHLPEVFAKLFALAEFPEGTPPFDKLDRQSFFAASKGMNIPSLGKPSVPDGDLSDFDAEGYLFSAYGSNSVKDVLSKL